MTTSLNTFTKKTDLHLVTKICRDRRDGYIAGPLAASEWSGSKN